MDQVLILVNRRAVRAPVFDLELLLLELQASHGLIS